VAGVQRLLKGTGEALIEYHLATESSHVWVITANGILMAALPRQAIVAQHVHRLRGLLARRTQNESDLAAYVPEAQMLYRMLIEPVQRSIQGKQSLIIVPDGVLHYLPFELLMPEPAAGNTSPPRLLLESFELSYAPSASALAELAIPAADPAYQRELLAYGDPELPIQNAVAKPQPAEIVRGGYETRGVQLRPLLSARQEIAAITQLFPQAQARGITGPNATEEAFKSEDLLSYRRIHFATHSIIDEDDPARSGLIFTRKRNGSDDGILQVGEIMNLRMNAELVVLSACQTALGRYDKGEGLIGLTRAFFFAGASRLLVSLWPANDAGTADLMRLFYEHLRKSEAPRTALRNAQIAMLHSPVAAYHHPYFWAPFILIGRP
jgi:CHAT domain-containing protein